MKIAVIGNGSVAMSIAETLSLDHEKKIDIFGPALRPGSASMAAGAMINVFSELEDEQLEDRVQKMRFQIAFNALRLWPDRVNLLEKVTGVDLVKRDGMTILKNSASTPFEKKHLNYLEKCSEKFPEHIEICEKSIELTTEFSIDARKYIEALQALLETRRNVHFVEYSGNYSFNSGYGAVTLGCDFGTRIRSYDKIIISAGAFSREIFRQNQMLFSDVIPLFYGIGSALKIFPNSDNDFRTKHGFGVLRTMNRGGACGYHMVNCGGYEYFGATNAIHHAPEYFPRVESLLNLTEHLKLEFSEMFSLDHVEPIVGFRPTPLDGMPLLGAIEDGRIIIATGNKRDGLTCSPELANQVQKLIDTGECDYPTLTPERKALSYFDKSRAMDKAALSKLSGDLLHKRIKISDFDYCYKKEISNLEEIYQKLNIQDDFGIHPELMNMYKFDRLS